MGFRTPLEQIAGPVTKLARRWAEPKRTLKSSVCVCEMHQALAYLILLDISTPSDAKQRNGKVSLIY